MAEAGGSRRKLIPKLIFYRLIRPNGVLHALLPFRRISQQKRGPYPPGWWLRPLRPKRQTEALESFTAWGRCLERRWEDV